MQIAKEDYWMPVEGRLKDFALPFIRAVEYNAFNADGIKDIQPQFYIYRNISKVTRMEHVGRYEAHLNAFGFPAEFRKLILEHNADLVFLVVNSKNQQFIIKAFQSCPDTGERAQKECDISKKMAELGVGPMLIDKRFPLSFGTHKINLIVEDCFTKGAGWRPLYLEQSRISKHQKRFALAFAEMLKKVHSTNTIYNDDFLTHIFINPASGQLRLIDFGYSDLVPNKDFLDYEVKIALKLLKEFMFPPELQNKFLDKYQRDFRKIRQNMRTDTVIELGREVLFER